MVKKKTVADLIFDGEHLNADREVGIEIEMEGFGLLCVDDAVPHPWVSTEDGSLRGNGEGEAVEYVFSRPQPRDQVQDSLISLCQALDDAKADIVPSIRTGVHVHVNIRDMTLPQLYSFIFTYLTVEDMLMDFCGKERVGNHFCLRAKDAATILEALEDVSDSKNLVDFDNNGIRYAAMNLCAIPKYGSLEFRGLPFRDDFDEINIWTEMLLAMKDFALTLDDPKQIISQISGKGAENFLKNVFGDLASYIPRPDGDLQQHLLCGIRRVQHIIYEADWDKEPKTAIIIPLGIHWGVNGIAFGKKKPLGLEEMLKAQAQVGNPVPEINVWLADDDFNEEQLAILDEVAPR